MNIFNQYLIIVIYMKDIFSTNYIGGRNMSQQNGSFPKPQDASENKDIRIHPGFSAGKLENQNECTNRSKDIPTLFEQGVTL